MKRQCPNCKADQTIIGFNHMHDTAHGMESTHMGGTERFECKGCDYQLSRSEAKERDLVYVLDVEN